LPEISVDDLGGWSLAIIFGLEHRLEKTPLSCHGRILICGKRPFLEASRPHHPRVTPPFALRPVKIRFAAYLQPVVRRSKSLYRTNYFAFYAPRVVQISYL
jgi:hypothetical protein